MSSISGVIIAYKNFEQANSLQDRIRGAGLHLTVYDNSHMNENIHTIWNRWLENCQADYFMVLNPDTKPEAGWLSELLMVMEHTHPRMAAVGPSTDHCYNEQANRHPEVVGLARGSWVPQVLIPGFCALYRTEALKQIGGWREDFKFYGGDLDLVYRLQLAGWMSAWAVGAFVWHEWGGSARKLGDEAYLELRRIGNEQLPAAIQSYQGRPGIWMAKPGGGVSYVEEGAITSQSQEDAGGGSGERAEALEEAAGTLRGNSLGETSQKKEGLTDN
jgi:hypothetical protein